MSPLLNILLYLLKYPIKSLKILCFPEFFPMGREVKKIFIDKEMNTINKVYRQKKLTCMHYNFQICTEYQDHLSFIPKLLDSGKDSLLQEYVGPLVDIRYNLPKDWKKQLVTMQKELNGVQILCDDVEVWDLNPYIVNNLCVKDGKLYIVDFGKWRTNRKKRTTFKKLMRDIEYAHSTTSWIVVPYHIINLFWKVGKNIIGKIIPDELKFFLLFIPFLFCILISSLVNYGKTLRVWIADFCFGLLFSSSHYLLKNHIHLSGTFDSIPKEELNIINANHTYQFDNFIFFYLFRHFNISGSKMTSISTKNGIGYMDKHILRLAETYFVQENGLPRWDSQKYVINYFEGIASCNTNHTTNKPKSLLLQKMLETYPEKMNYLTHLNIQYFYKGTTTPIRESNGDIWKLLLQHRVDIYVNIQHYKMPEAKNCEQWLNKLFKTKEY